MLYSDGLASIASRSPLPALGAPPFSRSKATKRKEQSNFLFTFILEAIYGYIIETQPPREAHTNCYPPSVQTFGGIVHHFFLIFHLLIKLKWNNNLPMVFQKCLCWSVPEGPKKS
jgi:hypothetical protein